jgi:D-arginine dehydrogenase
MGAARRSWTIDARMTLRADFAVVGAGIAGASLAHELSAHGTVIVLEAESQPGYHATGRSAALFSETYGNATVRALSAASRDVLETSPAFFGGPVLGPRGAMRVGRAEHEQALRAFVAECRLIQPSVCIIVAGEILRLVPILRPECAAIAAYEPDAREIETARMHQGYLRGLRQRGGTLLPDARVGAIRRAGAGWEIAAGSTSVSARILCNAAGAWADEIATLAGVRPLGLRALRRTAVILPPPPGIDVRGWPMVRDFDEQFYFKPDADRLLLSPADESPSAAVDAMPDDYDVAVAVDRFEAATTFAVRRVEHSWAGLRTFAPDRTPVVGCDDEAAGFFWFAGQGGYGFQIAPALAALGASLATGAGVPAGLASRGVEGAALSPLRLRERA